MPIRAAVENSPYERSIGRKPFGSFQRQTTEMSQEKTITDMNSSSRSSGASLPVVTLTVLGAVLAVLGLFAAGDISVVALGLGAIAAAGVIAVVEKAVDRRT